jgi:hypothetical protein
MAASLEHEMLARIPHPGRRWLVRALADHDLSRLATSFTLAPRFVRGDTLDDGSGGRRSHDWLFARAAADELARVALLVYAASLSDDAPSLALEWYRAGDNREKRAVVRSLALLPEPGEHVALGTMACRTSVTAVFEAICCENPFPAEFFPDGTFNQMVLKAYFTGIAVDRIMGLDRRRKPELRRMAADYASERRAAGRAVPPDLDRVLDPEVTFTNQSGEPR